MGAAERRSVVTLGWTIDAAGHPNFWLRPGARPGMQSNGDLVQISAPRLAAHTLIVGQSGSGKSLLLGRLVEELLLNTRAECLILDPNGDFSRMNSAEADALWERATYDQVGRRGKLPHEGHPDGFKVPWRSIRKRFLSQREDSSSAERETLRFPLVDVPAEILAEGLSPRARTELFLIHDATRDFGKLMEADVPSLGRRRTLSECIELLKSLLSSQADAADLVTADEVFRKGQLITKLSKSLSYVSQDAKAYYSAKLQELIAKGELSSLISAPQRDATLPTARLTVVDLPSVEYHDSRVRIVSALLTAEWDAARQRWFAALGIDADQDKRVPLFIVLDEAHNLIPETPIGEGQLHIRHLFRTISAEGRKYGLFLILCSQRPDKLDRFVMSECQNIAVMRLNSRRVIDQMATEIGLEEDLRAKLSECLQFTPGKVVLLGAWVDGRLRTIYTGARRTLEGGRNLRDQYWAVNPFA